MPVVFNGTTRQIEITDSSIFELEAGKELYSEWKRWQQLDPANAGYAPAFRTFGGDPTATGQNAPKYFFLINYWTVLIDNGNIVSVALNLYSDDFVTPYIVAAGSGVSDRNSDAVVVEGGGGGESSQFQGIVAIDTFNGNAVGTAYPLGTTDYPVATWAQAEAIATLRGFHRYQLSGSLVLPSGADLTGSSWQGDSHLATSLTLNQATGDGASFEALFITGSWAAGNAANQLYRQSTVSDLVNFDGSLEQCRLYGDITFDPAATKALIIDCLGSPPEEGNTVLNVSGMAVSLVGYNNTGPFELQGLTAGMHYWYSGLSSDLTIASSNTGGVVLVTSETAYTVETGSGTSVTPFLASQAVLDALQANHLLPDTIGESIGIGGDGSGGGGGSACDDPSKILVDHNYGGANNLVYVLNGKPVGDATIEVFLYADYMSGKRDGNYRIGNSRQRSDGSWAIPFYLDPQDYVLQFYRQGIAGPDAYKLTVSYTTSEIAFEQLPASATGLVGPATPPIQTKTVIRTITNTTVEGLDSFAGVGTVYVDHNYGGPGALTYTIGGQPVNGADVLIYSAADYNAGNRSNEFIVAASRQLSNGSWQQAVRLNPGSYKIQFYKQGVAGPDTYDLTVED